MISKLIIDLNHLNCSDCPAKNLKNSNHLERAQNIENLRIKEIYCNKWIFIPEILLLAESPPKNRFVYDRNSDYLKNGLRFNLKKELDCEKDEDLFTYLKEEKIWIIDCALCSLHKLETKKERRLAATICLRNNMIKYLNAFKNAHIILITPKKCGPSRTELFGIQPRLFERQIGFKCKGIKKAIEEIQNKTNKKNEAPAVRVCETAFLGR